MNEEKDKTITDPEEVGRERRAQRQTANTTAEPVATTTANETAKPGKYAFLYEQTAEKPMSESDLEKMAQREKRNMRFAKISDALRALAGTSGKKPSMVQTVSDRYNLMRDKDREARQRYLTGKMNAMMADDRDAMAQKTFDFQLAKHKDEQERLAKEYLDRAQREQREQARWEAERADRKEQAKKQYNLAERGLALNAAKMNDGKEFFAYDSEGNERRFYSAEAAEQYARQHGTWEPDVTTRTEKKDFIDVYGEPKSTTTEITQVTGGRSVKRDNTKSTPGEQTIIHQKQANSNSVQTGFKTKPAWQKDDDVVDYTPGGGGGEVIDYVPGKK